MSKNIIFDTIDPIKDCNRIQNNTHTHRVQYLCLTAYYARTVLYVYFIYANSFAYTKKAN